MLDGFKNITTFIFDADGVLTDGALYVFDTGEQVRRMNIKDGYALQLAIKKGYRIAVFSGSISEAVRSRLAKLGITDVFMGVENKMEAIKNFLEQYLTGWDKVLFMGDDIPDLPVMKMAAVACAPADAVQEIKQAAAYISYYNGGYGCVRDVIEKVLKLNGHWQSDTSIPSR
ncbi:MAG TPA: HAD hydrolase family protein [Flavitalea sp.]|nr:HAD hydrolase family protein [Flavitalea sp.]